MAKRSFGDFFDDPIRVSLATSDVTIAAVAIHHQLILITDNLKHYPMKELTLYPLPKN